MVVAACCLLVVGLASDGMSLQCRCLVGCLLDGQSREDKVGNESVNLALSRAAFPGELNKAKSGKAKDKELHLAGGAGFLKAVQAASCTETKVEATGSSKLVAKPEGVSKDMYYLLR